MTIPPVYVVKVHQGSDATGARFVRVSGCDGCAIARFLHDLPKLPAHMQPGGPHMDAEAFAAALVASAFADGASQVHALGPSRNEIRRRAKDALRADNDRIGYMV